jgi:UDP-N-acetylmuramyl tripeptide synthase
VCFLSASSPSKHYVLDVALRIAFNLLNTMVATLLAMRLGLKTGQLLAHGHPMVLGDL